MKNSLKLAVILVGLGVGALGGASGAAPDGDDDGDQNVIEIECGKDVISNEEVVVTGFGSTPDQALINAENNLHTAIYGWFRCKSENCYGPAPIRCDQAATPHYLVLP